MLDGVSQIMAYRTETAHDTHLIDIFRRDDRVLATEYKVISLGTERHGNTFPKKDEREHVAVLHAKSAKLSQVLNKRRADYLFSA